MNNARTIHLQRLDGCSSYDRFAKNAPAIVTPAKMPVPIVLSGVEQSHAPAGLGVLGRNLRTLRIIANRACVAQVIRLSLATQYPRHDVIDFERFGAQLLLQLTVFAAEFRALGDDLSKVLWDICRCGHCPSPRCACSIPLLSRAMGVLGAGYEDFPAWVSAQAMASV